MIWFTSDLHLGHRAVIQFCSRPFQSIEQMDSDLIRFWNGCVKADDTVYVLGDLCFHKPSLGVPILKGLLGRKILIRGNHDKYSDTQYHAAGFLGVFEEVKLKLGGHYVKVSHYPYWPTAEADDYQLRYQDRRPHNGGGWLLCGHVHEKWKFLDRQINVGVDQWGFMPVSERLICSHIQKTEEVV